MPAYKPIRRSQLISPWGIGQMINFPKDESLMVAGLDMWDEIFNSLSESEEFVITEERLAKRLGVSGFRLPPDYRDPGPGVRNPSLKIPFIRFPRWHYCTRCGQMEKVSIYHPQRPVCSGIKYSTGMTCADVPAGKRPKLIPVRFITICPEGHIQDFPFMEWVHGVFPAGGNHRLRLRAGRSSGALSGIEISCSCGKQRTMAGAFNANSLSNIVKCSGDRPWVGEESERQNTKYCGQNLTAVQKGASNVYFAQIRSSIHLPQWGKPVEKIMVDVLEKNWGFLTQGMENGEFQRVRFELVAERSFNIAMKECYTEKLLEAAHRRIAGNDTQTVDDSEEKYRKMEYDAILSESGGENEDFFVKKLGIENYSSSEPMSSILDGFTSIALLHKLRETRAFVGFSRLLPEDNKDLASRKNFIKIRKEIGWLPAIVVRGEGVFFEFDRSKIEKWAGRNDVEERVSLLSNNYKTTRHKRKEETVISPIFILLHTFAHILINQFSFECGYGSSSLRERIYCNLGSPENIMNGVLIYTSSGDAEGSLGGLVRQGKPGNLEGIIFNAIENAKWCSSDPICIDSHGQGPDSCNLAACHNCALLPETCCEASNMLLDRAMLIGTLDNPDMGYFSTV